MKILSYDIEDWAIARENGTGSKVLYGEYDVFLNRILNLLDQYGYKATFFCTGQMAEYFPQVVKLIHLRGHEIGCHSYRHTWMNKMTEAEAREDTHKAVDLLEQCIGEKVKSYRAPAFSIGKENKWMFEILVENGILNDSSVYPAKRDFGGFPDFESNTISLVKCNGITIKEFPIPMYEILGRRFAYSGGGYLRLFPLPLIKRQMKNDPYSIIYLHIADLMPEMNHVMTKQEYEDYFKEPGTLLARYKRFVKANLGKRNAWNKMENLISEISFKSLMQASEQIDWSGVRDYSL